MTLQRQVGQAIRRHRERRRMSQSDLAEACGRSLQTIGSIERGRSAPTFETLEAIGRALDVPVWQLFFTPREPTEAVNRITHLVSGRSEADLYKAERVLLAMFEEGQPFDRDS